LDITIPQRAVTKSKASMDVTIPQRTPTRSSVQKSAPTSTLSVDSNPANKAPLDIALLDNLMSSHLFQL
jgi:hypothetical protein